MMRFLVMLAALPLVACGGDDETAEKTYSGECVYLSDLHQFYDAAECELQANDLDCESWELEDRSSIDQTVWACIYTGCSADYDCDAFRSP